MRCNKGLCMLPVALLTLLLVTCSVRQCLETCFICWGRTVYAKLPYTCCLACVYATHVVRSLSRKSAKYVGTMLSGPVHSCCYFCRRLQALLLYLLQLLIATPAGNLSSNAYLSRWNGKSLGPTCLNASPQQPCFLQLQFEDAKGRRQGRWQRLRL